MVLDAKGVVIMGRDWKKWAADKGIQKMFRKDNFLILVLTGILLVIIALPTEKSGEGNAGPVPETEGAGTGAESDSQRDNNQSPQGTVQEASQGTDTDEAYAAYLEDRLTESLSQMADVGKVKVMITLKASRELVVEKEQPIARSSTNESDSAGGSRVVSEMDSDENTVYRTDGNLSEPYVVKTLSPQIEGVLVVAEGAGNGTVSRTIVEIAQALFDIEAHKVKVVKMVSDPNGKAGQPMP